MSENVVEYSLKTFWNQFARHCAFSEIQESTIEKRIRNSQMMDIPRDGILLR